VLIGALPRVSGFNSFLKKSKIWKIIWLMNRYNQVYSSHCIWVMI
ncbi:uncharacterized protein METZ01_LOCUS235369, partial [marine metagenome]